MTGAWLGSPFRELPASRPDASMNSLFYASGTTGTPKGTGSIDSPLLTRVARGWPGVLVTSAVRRRPSASTTSTRRGSGIMSGVRSASSTTIVTLGRSDASAGSARHPFEHIDN